MAAHRHSEPPSRRNATSEPSGGAAASEDVGGRLVSVKVMSWVWDHSQAKGNVRLVLLAIADSAEDHGGNAYPGIERLKDKTKLSERTVQQCIARLLELGELEIERPGRGGRDGGRVTVYRVLIGGGPPQMGADLAPIQPNASKMAPEQPRRPSSPCGEELGADPAPNSGEIPADSAVIEDLNDRSLRQERVQLSTPSPPPIPPSPPVDPSGPVQEHDDDLAVIIAGGAGDNDHDDAAGGQSTTAAAPGDATAAIRALQADLAGELAQGHRSWDLAGHAQRRFADLIDRLGDQLGPAQRFLAWYITALTGDQLEPSDWKRAMVLLRRWRALAIFGVDQALARGHVGDALWRYAEQVCKQAVREAGP